MGRRQMPIGTIRHWQNGDVIKAHENSIFHSGWIQLQTSSTLENIGRDCDHLANIMIKEKVPINGEIFLDHEINEFDKNPTTGDHPYNPENFKQYEGFYGAGRYSFRNEFSKRFMADKIKLQSEINEALMMANGGRNHGPNKRITLSKSEIEDIKIQTKHHFKFDNKFTVKEASELQGIVKRTYNQLAKGVNFDTDKERQVYEYAVKTANSLPLEYQRIKIKREQKEDAINQINETFKDNWGVCESVKNLLDEKYGEYVRKYATQIRDDEAHDQETLFGVALDASFEEFYKKLFAKVKKDKDKLKTVDWNKHIGETYTDKKGTTWRIGFDKDEEIHSSNGSHYIVDNSLIQGSEEEQFSRFYFRDGSWQSDIEEFLDPDESEAIRFVASNIANKESDYPFKELVYLRFETLYNKQMDGDWSIDMLPAIYNIERLMHELPKGHFETNTELRQITNKDVGDGGLGYAYYSPDNKRINFSNRAANSFQIWGDLFSRSDFDFTCAHEVGHAVSNKFGRDNNLLYKKFVVACGWSYQQMNFTLEGSSSHATGTDSDIKREGTNSITPLISEYAQKSPEEAFAEYYSMYANNQEAINKWLDTGNAHHLEKISKLVTEKKLENQPILESVLKTRDEDTDIESVIKKQLNLNADDHVKMDLINPWHVKYNKALEVEEKREGLYKVRASDNLPTIVIKKGINSYEGLGHERINEGFKYKHKFAPAVVISEELYTQLKKRGYSNRTIENYCVHKLRNERIPTQNSKPQFRKGLEFRSNIIDVEELKKNQARFMAMRAIFDSPDLKKALRSLFALDTMRDILTEDNPTRLVDESGHEFDILKAKTNFLVNQIEEFDKEIVNLKPLIDQ